MKIKLLFILLVACHSISSQEIQSVNKQSFGNAFNSKYLGESNSKHFILNYNQNVFRSDLKNIDEDKLAPKTTLSLISYNTNGVLENKMPLVCEYKFQEILFAGIIDNHFSIIYSSKKGKGTIHEKFDLNGQSVKFDLLSSEKKGNYIKVTDSSKFILHFTKEDCYVYDSKLENIDKFPYSTEQIIDIVNYKDGFILLSHSEGEVEMTRYSPSENLTHEKISENSNWIYKSPRLSVDALDPNRFYLSYLIGKKDGSPGGWDHQDSRTDFDYRSKGIKVCYYEDWGSKLKERSVLFESNIIYGTNSNANSEQVMGCTNLSNLGIMNYNNSLLVILEERTMKVTETVNQLTGGKKITHQFKYNDMVFVKLDQVTSIQNFLIKGCHVNMDENKFGGPYIYPKGNKIKILFNQTYLREKRNKLLIASMDMYLEQESKILMDSFNDSGLNLVLNPTENYIKSKYFLALQNDFLDLVLLEE